MSKADQPFIAVYCSSKGTLATFTDSACIRVNGLNIGWTATGGEVQIERQHHDASADWLKQVAARPFGRLVAPQQIVHAVAFLSTDESDLMTDPC